MSAQVHQDPSAKALEAMKLTQDWMRIGSPTEQRFEPRKGLGVTHEDNSPPPEWELGRAEILSIRHK